MNDVRLDQVLFRYGGVVAADRVDLTVHQGEFFALLGPSGSGKTTILRLIAGFLQPQDGDITIGGRSLINVPIYQRNIGFVFQNYALFPHMSVAKNISFGLENRKMTRAEIQTRVDEVLDLVELAGLASRQPKELSGGQQQRVALARAIVTEPNVLLLDEPLAALDKKLRTQMQVELRELQQRLGITTLFVTHDQEEAMALADRIAVMARGRIVQVGPPREVYEHPRTRFVCDFLGEANILEGTVESVNGRLVVMVTSGGHRVAAQTDQPYARGEQIIMAVRPERVDLETSLPDAEIVLPGRVQHIAYVGASQNYHVQLDDGTPMIVFEQSGFRETPPTIGQRVWLSWPRAETVVLTADDRMDG